MKRVIESHFIAEEAIHGTALFLQKMNQIQVLYEDFVKKNLTLFQPRRCPACGGSDCIHAFKKIGNDYQLCNNCFSIYLSPCPIEANITDFYQKDDVKQLLSDAALVDDEETRLSSVWEWRLNMLGTIIRSGENFKIAEIGAKHNAFTTRFCLHYPNVSIDSYPAYYQIGRNAPLSALRGDSLSGSQYDCITVFDYIESVVSIEERLSFAYSLLKEGGRLVITTRSGSGFDINVLWDKAVIFPSEHRNLVSVKGINILLNKLGFVIEEVSTPGQLDVEIVRKKIDVISDEQRFVKTILNSDDHNLMANFQNFLQENLLSSHMLVVCRKP